MEELRRIDHRAHHQIHQNQPPHEQILSIVDRTGRCFKQAMARDIIEVVNSYDITQMYHPKCVDMEKMIRVLAEKIILDGKK